MACSYDRRNLDKAQDEKELIRTHWEVYILGWERGKPPNWLNAWKLKQLTCNWSLCPMPNAGFLPDTRNTEEKTTIACCRGEWCVAGYTSESAVSTLPNSISDKEHDPLSSPLDTLLSLSSPLMCPTTSSMPCEKAGSFQEHLPYQDIHPCYGMLVNCEPVEHSGKMDLTPCLSLNYCCFSREQLFTRSLVDLLHKHLPSTY